MTVALAAADPLRAVARPFVPDALSGRLPARGARMYATVRATAAASAGIALYQWSGAAWLRQQLLSAEGAGPLLVNPEGRCLFVAHRAASTGMPAGSTEVLRIDARTGRLTRGEQQPLALASRNPLALALSPDREMLAVLAAGGVFSLLPVQTDGSLAQVSAAYKHLAASISQLDEASLWFKEGTSGQLSGRETPTLARLMLQTGTRCLEYECRTDGLTLTGSSEARSGPSAEVTKALPAGVCSFVMQPPIG